MSPFVASLVTLSCSSLDIHNQTSEAINGQPTAIADAFRPMCAMLEVQQLRASLQKQGTLLADKAPTFSVSDLTVGTCDSPNSWLQDLCATAPHRLPPLGLREADCSNRAPQNCPSDQSTASAATVVVQQPSHGSCAGDVQDTSSGVAAQSY
jgi:hypothetical protein